MADYQLVIIGGGLSGLAAGIRAARFGLSTLILEQHDRAGGLNSYYVRQGRLFETGLHAMTNFADPGDKRAPLNRLFRQLHLSRRQFSLHPQLGSEIRFAGRSLRFSNDPVLLETEVDREFPGAVDGFRRLRQAVAACDPFAPAPWRSARAFLSRHLAHRRLEDMLLLPLMLYGNAEELDMDLAQFVIMFNAVFEEGFFRPAGTMRDFLDLLVRQFQEFGGELRTRAPVADIRIEQGRCRGVRLESGEEIGALMVLSTAGMPETIRLSGWKAAPARFRGRMSFVETISVLPKEAAAALAPGRTILFYHQGAEFAYQRPQALMDPGWGVICFPERFVDLPATEEAQVRVTCAAGYPAWQGLDQGEYRAAKARSTRAAVAASEELIGNYHQSIVYQDSFTPMTIERFTRKAEGAVYGSSEKIKDGATPWPNLFVAGTDQGFLGIVGAMLSGITMVNRHILSD